MSYRGFAGKNAKTGQMLATLRGGIICVMLYQGRQVYHMLPSQIRSALGIGGNAKKEEVAEYFLKNYKITEEAKNNIIKEDISGDILLNINDADYKYLKIKIGQYKKIQKYLEKNKDNFKEKEIKEVITVKSKPEEIKNFFERCLNFKGNLNDLDGKGLIDLDEEGMKKLGLNLGQRKKLPKYIEYFKTLKIEEPPKEEEEIIISKKSSEEEVAKFLEMRLKFSKDAIEALALDGESLYLLKDPDIDELTELTEKEKENLKKYLNDSKNEDKKEQIIVITKKSTNEEVAKFLKNKLGFKNESIEALDLDGESIFLLKDSEIDELTELSEEERDNLKKFLNEEKLKNGQNEPSKPEKDSNTGQKQDEVEEQKPEQEHEKELILTEKSTKDEVNKYLKEKLKFSDIALKSFELDGKNLFSIDANGIEELEGMNEEEKDNLRKFLNIKKPSREEKDKKIRKKITKENTKEELKEFFKQNLNLEREEYDSINESQIDKLHELTEDEKDILKQFLKEQKEKIKLIKSYKPKEDNNEQSSTNSDNKNIHESSSDIYKNDVKKKDTDKLKNLDINIDEDISNTESKQKGINREKTNSPEDNSSDKKKNDVDKKNYNFNHPLDNKIVEEEKVEKEEKKSNRKQFYNFINYKIEPIYTKSKYNIFFSITIQDKYNKSVNLAAYLDVSSMLYFYCINYEIRIIHE